MRLLKMTASTIGHVGTSKAWPETELEDLAVSQKS